MPSCSERNNEPSDSCKVKNLRILLLFKSLLDSVKGKFHPRTGHEGPKGE